MIGHHAIRVHREPMRGGLFAENRDQLRGVPGVGEHGTPACAAKPNEIRGLAYVLEPVKEDVLVSERHSSCPTAAIMDRNAQNAKRKAPA